MGKLSRKKRERRKAQAGQSRPKLDAPFRAQASVKACGCGAAIEAWQFRCRYCTMGQAVKTPQMKPAVVKRGRGELEAMFPGAMLAGLAMAHRMERR
jgi:hypothetical protein